MALREAARLLGAEWKEAHLPPGLCLRELRRFEEAAESFARAARLRDSAL